MGLRMRGAYAIIGLANANIHIARLLHSMMTREIIIFHRNGHMIS